MLAGQLGQHPVYLWTLAMFRPLAAKNLGKRKSPSQRTGPHPEQGAALCLLLRGRLLLAFGRRWLGHGFGGGLGRNFGPLRRNCEGINPTN